MIVFSFERFGFHDRAGLVICDSMVEWFSHDFF